jgi:hypothetical protein
MRSPALLRREERRERLDRPPREPEAPQTPCVSRAASSPRSAVGRKAATRTGRHGGGRRAHARAPDTRAAGAAYSPGREQTPIRALALRRAMYPAARRAARRRQRGSGRAAKDRSPIEASARRLERPVIGVAGESVMATMAARRTRSTNAAEDPGSGAPAIAPREAARAQRQRQDEDGSRPSRERDVCRRWTWRFAARAARKARSEGEEPDPFWVRQGQHGHVAIAWPAGRRCSPACASGITNRFDGRRGRRETARRGARPRGARFSAHSPCGTGAAAEARRRTRERMERQVIDGPVARAAPRPIGRNESRRLARSGEAREDPVGDRERRQDGPPRLDDRFDPRSRARPVLVLGSRPRVRSRTRPPKLRSTSATRCAMSPEGSGSGGNRRAVRSPPGARTGRRHPP